MRLKIKLFKPNNSFDSVEMYFNLFETKISKRFIVLVNKANELNSEVVSSWGLSVGRKNIAYHMQNINSAIKEFNEINVLGVKIPYEVDETNLTNNLLNLIHDLFEKFSYQIREQKIEKGNDNITNTLEKLDSINNNVHLLESKLMMSKDKQILKSYFTSRLKLLDSEHYYEENLEELDYDVFTMEETFGALYLNYATTGKSLHQIFLANDIDLLESSGQARPQKVITPGIMALFNNIKKHHNEEIERYNDWFDENRIERFGYSKFDKFNGLGFIRIGSLAPFGLAKEFYSDEFECFKPWELVKAYEPYSEIAEMSIV